MGPVILHRLFLLHQFPDLSTATGKVNGFAGLRFSYCMKTVFADPVPGPAAILTMVNAVQPATDPAFFFQVFHAAPVAMRGHIGYSPGLSAIIGDHTVFIYGILFSEVAANNDKTMGVLNTDRIGAGGF